MYLILIEWENQNDRSRWTEFETAISRAAAEEEIASRQRDAAATGRKKIRKQFVCKVESANVG